MLAILAGLIPALRAGRLSSEDARLEILGAMIPYRWASVGADREELETLYLHILTCEVGDSF